MKLNPTKCSFGVSSKKFLGYMVTRRGIEDNHDQIKAIVEIKSPRNFKEVQRLTGRVAALNKFISRLSDKCHLFYNVLRKNKVSAVPVREDGKQQLPIYYSVLRKPELAGRLAKRSIYLNNYNIDFKPKTAIKSQILADFVADFIPQLEKEAQSEVCTGATNPGLYMSTAPNNNEAEYESLIVGMNMAHDLREKGLHVKSDSLLAVNQMNGEFAAKDSKMTAYLKVAKAKSAKFEPFSIKQIPRDLNTQADALANLGLALRNHRSMLILVDATNKMQSSMYRIVTHVSDTQTPRYPQSNGLVDSSNKKIINSIKKRLKAGKGRWVEELPSVLWPNCTTPSTSTGQTPFSLVYGCEAVLSIEVQLPVSRHTSVDHNIVDMSYDLDALEELRESELIRMASEKQTVERHFNKNVKTKVFQVGDHVLRRVFQNTQEPNAGKLSIKWDCPYRISQVVGKGAYRLQTLDDQEIPCSGNATHLKRIARYKTTSLSHDTRLQVFRTN
ncbi:hypothetical protein L6452_09097 [Arctium lappa]|uniref:Uncharacterized protein n=1 Tax=Arctium lappa TaxID=4217 RepID=A0ACB9DJX4_ARCLA|nr:hypothetical protein L6452_09097 [Arctium lappa]